MGFIKTYFWEAVRFHYADFRGRSSRKQFWFFYFIDTMLVTIVNVTLYICNLLTEDINNTHFAVIATLLLICLIPILPRIAITTRRLHDANLSG